MSDSVTLPGTGALVETLDTSAGANKGQRQVVTIAPRDLSGVDSIGSLTETAPENDTASAGINGRLQRIAQRLSSLIVLLPTALGAGGGLKVDGSGTALPVSGTVTANAGTGNHSVVPGSTETAATGVSIGTSGVGYLGWLSTIAKLLSGTIAVSGTFFQATQPISAAALPLPTGAATSAEQALQLTQETAINTVLGTTAGAAVVTDATGAIQQYLRGLVKMIAGGITVATHAVTQSGSWVLSASSAIIGKVGIDQSTPGTTNKVSIGTDGTVALAAGSAAIGSVTISNANANGQEVMAESAPVVIASDQSSIPVAATLSAETTKVIGTVNLSASQLITPVDQYGHYETVAASQTAQALGATGAAGDYLSHVTVFPGAAGCGVVTILDNATTIGTFAGGGTTALPSLVPFMIPVGLFSVSGAWKITTGANVTAVGVGKFT